LRLRRRGRRWRLRHHRASGARLCDRLRCWNGLATLTGGDGYTARDDRGGGYAEPGPGDEIASGDDRASPFFSRLGTDGLGRWLAC
jgi:hypothetical protein